MNHLLRRTAILILLLPIFILSTSSSVLAQQSSTPSLLASAPGNLLTNGGFEANSPAYWTATGEGAIWADQVQRTGGYSLALSGSGEASWTMGEAVRNWTPSFPGNTELVVGGWVRTEGVNTSPSSEAEKYQLVFNFYNSAGENLLGQELAIDLPQDQVSTDGWVKIDNTVLGALTLPENATSATITFRKGAEATGSAYLDDLFINAAEEGVWPGDLFNANVDASSTWYYWWPDFPRGLASWSDGAPFTHTVTSEESHSGDYALKIVENDTSASESVAISDRVPVAAGEPTLISFWVKTESVPEPQKIGDPEAGNYNIGLTALFYNQMESGAAGFGEIGGLDIRLNGDYNENVIPLLPRTEETGWTQYAFVVYPLNDAVGMEIRLRYWHNFRGVTYWDDVSIASLGGELVSTAIDQPGTDTPTIPGEFSIRLKSNFPNPFSSTTTIVFELSKPQTVSLDVYDVLGRRVAQIVNQRSLPARSYRIRFDASDLASGTYTYVLRSESGQTVARRMLVIH